MSACSGQIRAHSPTAYESAAFLRREIRNEDVVHVAAVVDEEDDGGVRVDRREPVLVGVPEPHAVERAADPPCERVADPEVEVRVELGDDFARIASRCAAARPNASTPVARSSACAASWTCGSSTRRAIRTSRLVSLKGGMRILSRASTSSRTRLTRRRRIQRAPGRTKWPTIAHSASAASRTATQIGSVTIEAVRRGSREPAIRLPDRRLPSQKTIRGPRGRRSAR